MEITYEQIRKANETIRTTNVSGKEYAEVNQRIKAFRMVYPQGFIETQIMSHGEGVVIFRSVVGYYEAGQRIVIGVGTAYERENSSFINKTSYIENCETSAVGRALGMAGFGIDTSVCSAEELQNAKMNQEKRPEPKAKAEPAKKTTEQMAKEMNLPELPTDRQELYGLLQDLGTDLTKVAIAFKCKGIDDVPVEKLQQALVMKMQKQKKGAQA